MENKIGEIDLILLDFIHHLGGLIKPIITLQTKGTTLAELGDKRKNLRGKPFYMQTLNPKLLLTRYN